MTAESRRPGPKGFMLGAAVVWLLGFGAYAVLDAWRKEGRVYVIDDTGARAISMATYEQRKNDRDLAGQTLQATPGGVTYVVSNVSLPKFRTDIKRQHRMVSFNHDEQGWFRLVERLVWAIVPLLLMGFGLGAHRLWRRFTATSPS